MTRPGRALVRRARRLNRTFSHIRIGVASAVACILCLVALCACHPIPLAWAVDAQADEDAPAEVVPAQDVPALALEEPGRMADGAAEEAAGSGESDADDAALLANDAGTSDEQGVPHAPADAAVDATQELPDGERPVDDDREDGSEQPLPPSEEPSVDEDDAALPDDADAAENDGAVAEDPLPVADPVLQISADDCGWAAVVLEGVPLGASLKLELAEGVGADTGLLGAAVPGARCTVEWSDEFGCHPAIWVDDVSDGSYTFAGALFASVEAASLFVDGERAVTAYPEAEVPLMLLAAAPGEQKWMELGPKAFYDNYLTFHFTVDGHSAQCANPMLRQPESGMYTVADPWSIETIQGWSVGYRWDEVRYAMYYGPDGPGYEFGKEHIWPRTNWNGQPCSDDDIYVMQHILIADTAFSDGNSALYGCSAGFIDWVHYNVTGFDEYGNVVSHDAAGRKIAEGGAYGDWIPAPPDDFDVFMLYTGSVTQYIIGMDYELAGSVELVKASAEPGATSGNPGYSLAGAVYEIRAQDGSVVATLTTDEGGRARADGIAAGSYTVVEVEAPAGFAVDETPIDVVVEAGQTARLEHADVPLLGAIELQKHDAQADGAQGDATLAGAVFDVLNASDGPVTVAGKAVGPGEVVATVTTDDAGHAQTGPILPLGNYTVVESKAPDGYSLDAGWSQTVEVQGHATYSVNASDQVLLGSISIEKVDADTGAPVGQGSASLSGARFSIVNSSAAGIVYGQRSVAPGEEVCTVVTDESGHAAVEGLPWGTYTVTEAQAPTGYRVAEGWSKTVEVRSEQPVELSGADGVADEVVRGGISLVKLDAQTMEAAAQGDAVLEGARFDVVNASEHTVVVGGRSYDPGDTVMSVATDAAGFAETGDVLPYGDYTVVEVEAPEGYLLADGWSQTVSVRGEGCVALDGASRPSDEVVRGGICLEKVDAQTLANTAQGDASLAGARFDVVNRSAAAVVVEGRTVGVGQTALTLTTDAQGRAQTAQDALPYGTYEVVEVAAPPGYVLPEGASRTVRVRQNATVVPCGDAFVDEVRRGALDVQKVDAETGGTSPLGAATLEGTSFDVINNSREAVVIDGRAYAVGERVATIVCDADGYARTDGNLPYGTYAVIETEPPTGYCAGDGRSINVEVRTSGETAHASSFAKPFADQVKRGDVRFNKADEDSMARMGSVAFLITSATTGESHVVVSDENGSVDTSSSWSAHSERTNANDGALRPDGSVDDGALDPGAGVWFCGSRGGHSAPQDHLGALPYDTYRVQELACAANEGMRLVSFDVVVTRHGVDVDMGTVDDKRAPSIATELFGPGEVHVVEASGSVELVDSVGYMNVSPGAYALDMELVYADTGEAVVDVSTGKPVTGHLDFTAVSSSGIARVPVTFDARGLEGRSVVAFERLTCSGRFVAEHRDLSDEGQTVSVVAKPEIKTTLVEKGTKRHEAYAGMVELVDTVTYAGLVPGKEYALYGVLRDKTTGLPVRDASGGEVSSVVAFTPREASGTAEVPFSFDASSIAGTSVVAFEELSVGKKVVAVHCDIDDEAQTVTFPSISTTLTGKDGGKAIAAAEKAGLVDVVEYHGLEPGATYELEGKLVDKSAVDATARQAEPAKASLTFVPDAADGTCSLAFEFDARPFGGHELVAFETLLRDGKIVASHNDLSSASQTAYVEKPDEPVAPPEAPVRTVVRELVHTGDSIEADRPLAVAVAGLATVLLAGGIAAAVRVRGSRTR